MILEVDYLMGDPGIYTARYAGENATYEDNMNKLKPDVSSRMGNDSDTGTS